MQAYFTQWAAAGTEEERKLTRTLIITIGNSNLLHRIIYQGEKLRVHPCPVCEGSWSGLHCDAGLCGGCGWLPNPPWLENKPDLDGTKVYVVTVSDDGEGVRDSCASIHGTEGAGKAAEKEERKGSWDEVKLFEWTVGVIGSEKRVT
jgi:hypothetical protein